MRGRSGSIAAWGAVGCAGLAALLYALLIMHAFRESWIYEGWVFLAQVGCAVVGLGLAAWGFRARPIPCGIAAVVSGYFVLTQLVL